MGSKVTKVTIVQRILPHYRIAFFDALQRTLGADNIELSVVYGQAYPGTVPQTKRCNYAWGREIVNRYYNFAGQELVWQPCSHLLNGSDLIIVEQAGRLLLNYTLLFGWAARGSKLAYWGHGRNMQARHSLVWREYIKRALITKVDWWFAYTSLSAKAIQSAGYPVSKISIVQNTIDTSALADSLSKCTEEQVHSIKAELGLAGKNICLYCGGMYEFKNLDFLIRACALIKERIPDFEMIFVGNGPEQHRVEKAASCYPWMRYVGPKFGQSLVPYYRMSKALLIPGLVGLAVVDSFVAGVPLFTTNIRTHSPEIAYLENGKNGIIAPATEIAFADAVVTYLQGNQSQQEKLRDGCRESAELYTLPNMVTNFANGVRCCLGM